ncbi:MAG TPA: DNA helicase RecQ [Phycisphaerae bacterium]|nr:DNA helicase RecQ [Phycisphaerae bacterium]HRW54751.1 DNA helicase RecQ [Phycisphaerae bacterium]
MGKIRVVMLTDANRNDVLAALRQYWGYDALRPLQEEAIAAGLARRDSLVVMPTGGGKSLCFQLPPLVADRTDIVISPLIALMKDQVDGLRANGYPAAAIYSGLDDGERRKISDDLQNGKLRLLFVSPEKLLTGGFIRFLQTLKIRSFAVDEAHCVSHWGHDFRPEYRRLAELKRSFRDASIHAFTATATQRVRDDIIRQLGLEDPTVLVGDFDRPNLIYRVIPRQDRYAQITHVLTRHKGQAGIVYCISRRDTESVCHELKARGFNAAFYHAGLTAEARRKTQEAFSKEKVDIVVATVAFGMGIDRSDVRCVVHAGMPKSVEHYQQEAGRAGRDGLEAECVLLYSTADVMKWQDLISKSAEEAGVGGNVQQSMLELLSHIQRYASGMSCRHASLVNYFGQRFNRENCEACDVCLGEIEGVEDATVLAQKILSCVARTEERFGVGHLVDVLKGADTARVRQFGHHTLSTHGLLAEMDKDSIKRRIYDVLDQGLLERRSIDGGEQSFQVLGLNAQSWEVMRGDRRVMLRELGSRRVRTTKIDANSWEGVDRGLFEHLRGLRNSMAAERDVPAYVVFGDATLRDLARKRPIDVGLLQSVHGIGATKAAEFGEALVKVIRTHCANANIETNVGIDAGMAAPKRKSTRPSAQKRRAFEMFEQGASLAETSEEIGRALSTTQQYLAEYIESQAPEDISCWVDPATQDRVRASLAREGTRRLRIVFDALNGEVDYDTIRLVAAHMNAPPNS